jgi:hypothetical protein
MEINIEIDDARDFQKVAYVLDWDKTLKYMLDIRKNWLEVNQLKFISYDKISDIEKNEGLENIINFIEKYCLYNIDYAKQTASLLHDIINKYKDEKSFKAIYSIEIEKINKDLSELAIVEYEIECLLKKLGLKANWKQLMIKAILTGVIKQYDFDNLARYTDKFTYNDWLFDSEIYRPLTRREYTGETKSAIKLHRQWYWLNDESNEDKLGYRKIGKKFKVNYQTVRSGINDYITFLE